MNYKDEFKAIVKKDFENWKNTGKCQKAIELNENIKSIENKVDIAAPHYFTGDISSKIVLIHLNPKRDVKRFGAKSEFNTFEDYWNHYENYGKISYGINGDRRKDVSLFDYKQVRFLKPFNVIPFDGDKFHELEMAIDKKLQIELIPYGSPNFNYKLIGINNINPFIENILKLILSYERKYVIFCGRVFCDILSDYSIGENNYQSFKLEKTNGDKTKVDFEIIGIKLKLDNKVIDAYIAPQFAMQGAPISAYAKKIVELLNDK